MGGAGMSARTILAAALLLAASPAAADDMFVPLPKGMDWDEVMKPDAMQFSLVAAGNRHVLVAWGQIAGGDSERFRMALDQARPIAEVWLDSPGGSLEEGLEMGRILRARKVTTRVPRGLHCISACNFAFMGGTVRYVEVGAEFGVHMFSSDAADRIRSHLVKPPETVTEYNMQFPQGQLDPDGVETYIAKYNAAHPDSPKTLSALLLDQALDEDTKAIQQGSAQTAAEIARYLTEMSLSLRFLTEFADIPNSAPRALSRQELRDFNVVNTD
jgi:hypothetical protein